MCCAVAAALGAAGSDFLVPLEKCTRGPRYIVLNMTQARLNHAAVCAVYPEQLHALHRQALMRQFATLTPQRVNVFSC